jgi:hypothetical protein
MTKIGYYNTQGTHYTSLKAALRDGNTRLRFVSHFAKTKRGQPPIWEMRVKLNGEPLDSWELSLPQSGEYSIPTITYSDLDVFNAVCPCIEYLN